MSDLLRRLLAFFVLPVGEDDPPADPPGDDPPADDPPGDDPPADDPADDDPPADDPPPARRDTAEELRAAREETRLAREEAEELRRRQAPPPGQDDESKLRADEDRVLNDAKATDLQKWQVRSNRTLRENNQQSRNSLAQAQDLNDRTKFDRIEPALLKKYGDRVEKELTRLRSQGQNAPREAILRYMIGDDAMKGEIKAKKAPPVDRGKSPNARSDVRAKGNGATRKQQLEKKLDGVQI